MAYDRRLPSFPQWKYPSYRDTQLKSPYQWLKDKRDHDNAEGLWRIHDSLYDLHDFTASHPGGKHWIETTKGTDITEAFETHHLKGVAETLLPKYFVRKTSLPRNSPFTFHEDGFYMTLKAKIASKLKEIPPEIRRKSDIVTDTLLVLVLILSPFSCWIWTKSHILGTVTMILNGYALSSLATCAHNYFHRTDSWRMYLMNLSGLSYQDWRISHAMSHHLFTNTFNDIELAVLEPFLQFFPYRDKNFIAQLGALYWPVIYSMSAYAFYIKELITGLCRIDGKKLNITNSIPILLVSWMYWLGGLSLMGTIGVWIFSMLACGFFFVTFGLTAGHHAHTNFFEGDVPRGDTVDWGVHQMDTVIEREDITEDHYKSITRFGNHTLHHLFPTIDHAELPLLYPTLIQHCEKFDVEFRSFTFLPALISHCKALMRNEPRNMKDMRKKHY